MSSEVGLHRLHELCIFFANRWLSRERCSFHHVSCFVRAVRVFYTPSYCDVHVNSECRADEGPSEPRAALAGLVLPHDNSLFPLRPPEIFARPDAVLSSP